MERMLLGDFMLWKILKGGEEEIKVKERKQREITAMKRFYKMKCPQETVPKLRF